MPLIWLVTTGKFGALLSVSKVLPIASDCTAMLPTTPLTRDNAARIHSLATELLHYSPEPRVIDVAIESAMLLHLDGEASWLLARYRAAFPNDYESWAKAGALRHRPAGAIKD